MKANELRIGNTINYVTLNNVKLVTVDASLIMELEPDSGAGSNRLYKPIPLTEEWLLKFGFEKVSGWDYYKGWIKDYVELECDCYGFDYVNNIDKEVKHVHQLQNLYFALTGKELELI
jgi:hypothetical protein